MVSSRMRARFRSAICAVALMPLCMTALSQQDPYSWTKQYSDPQKLALAIATKGGELFSGLAYGTTWAVYRVGGGIAMYGGAYILLESPSFAVDMASGNFYGIGLTVGKDAFMNVVEETIRTPGTFCKKLSQSTIDEGLKDYKVACDVIDRYRKTKTMSRTDAILFLDRRWGLYKLAGARQLYNDIISSKYSIDKQFADKTVSELIERYQKMLGLSKFVPLSTAASALVDLNSIETSRKIGLQHYPPYVTFTNVMTQVNKYRLEEARRFSGRAVKP
jgi:hypothetical protein